MSGTVAIGSEVAYDLLQDHFETILGLLEAPVPRAELARRVGGERTLDRLVRHGLLAVDGDEVRAVGSVYQQVRQEGMLSFLSRYVLPALASSVEGDGFAGLSTRALTLSPAAMTSLRPGAVQQLFEELGAISDAPARGPLGRMTVLVIGTSDLVREQLPDDACALEHLRRASAQRARPDERARAILAQGDFLADGERFARACERVSAFALALEPSRAASAALANYHLTLAYHWRPPAAGGAYHEVRQS